MTDLDTISADYTLRPSELAATLALLVEARQPVILWGAPGSAKSAVAQQVAADAARQYVDVRALLLDPVDLRGIPWRDSADRTRWAPPAFLPPTDDPGRWLINLEELPSAVPMVQAALYQLVLDRKVGEYELPEGASLIRARAGDSAELRHPFHAMIAGHVTGEKQRRDYRDRRPDRRRLRMGQSRPPGGAARAVLSLSSPPPQRPRPHSLAGAPGSGGGSAPVV